MASCFNHLEIYTKDLDKIWNKEREEVDFSILMPIPNENAFNSKIENQDEDKTVITFNSYWGIKNCIGYLEPIQYHWDCPKWIDALRKNDIEFSIYCEQEMGEKFLKAYVDGHWCQTNIRNDFTKEELDGYTIENLKKGIKDEFESGYKYNILLSEESWEKATVLYAVEVREEMETIGKDKTKTKEKEMDK